MAKETFVFILIFVNLYYFSFCANDSYLVTALPGQPQVNFKQYAGHIQVNETAARYLFFWFYEADHPNASSLPLVLWLNGGPGCSSVGAGALAEIGPFRVNSDNKLIVNPNSWIQAANIIFLEVPYNTGFSYTNLYSDGGFWTDNQTAVDSLAFLVEFLTQFPEYKQNELFITGESFAGHFIPTLASQILAYNEQGDVHINFKGFAIGNPSTDDAYDTPGNYETLYSHSVISEEVYQDWLRYCRRSDDESLSRCSNVERRISQMTQFLDPYNIYAPNCNNFAPLGGRRRSTAELQHAYHRRLATTSTDPCQDTDFVTPYLNLPEVQAALHVQNRPVRWRRCTYDVDRSYLPEDKNRSLLPVYKSIFGRGLRIWIYSGNFDTVVSTLSTRHWINALNLTVVTPWYAWNYSTQVGGWTEVYSDLTFATVRASGHMPPVDKPGEALLLFKTFLQGKSLPSF